jgi:AraC-like DNA-binding protein
MSAADAAAAAGFAHQSHFTRVLKRYYSVTPREYIAGLR